MQIVSQETKTLKVRDNDRSADAIAPNFIYGCCGGCMRSYCYVGRYNNDKVYLNTNTFKILEKISKWVETKHWPKVPNQVDDTYYVVDIGCSTDVGLHWKHYDWQKVLDYFKLHPKLKSTFATKYPSKVPDVGTPTKHRVRVSLMPQVYSDILEAGTDKISVRLEQIPRLAKSFEVHINFSPIIYDKNWKEEYRLLFEQIKSLGVDFKSECIFLTYSYQQKAQNSEKVNELCYDEDLQEIKTSQYGGDVLRYRHQIKAKFIREFKELYSEYFDLDTIRYIF